MQIDTIFFDLDSTLYPESCGLWQAIRDRIDLYMLDVLGIHQNEIPSIRHSLFINHGTTLKGLQKHYNVDPNHYLDFVHDLPLKDYIQSDHQLREMLLEIPHRRCVFTNSDFAHANRVLAILGIQDCFESIIDVWTMDPFIKPMKSAYTFALNFVGGANPNNCVFLDDSLYNLEPAKKMGFFTVYVGSNGDHWSADRTIADIHKLHEAVPELWNQ